MIHVKICSIQDLTHAVAAAEAGADYVGFNFVPGVRRQLEEGKARYIIKSYRQRFGRLGPSLVGVFVDQSLSEVNRILDTCDLDVAQLSGQESKEYCLRVERPVIKVVHVPAVNPVEPVIKALDTTLAELEAVNILPLLDPAVPNSRGGTGNTFDWTIARELMPSHHFLLAGGLSPENVRQAVAMVHPWGVDVSSGVETGGVKDIERIVNFVRTARAAEESI